MSTDKALAGPDRYRPVVLRLVALLLIAAVLAGCGKRGSPSPPPDEPSTYPRSYPSE